MMPYRFDRVFRLEPRYAAADLAKGIRAEVADPLWFLGRQWQLGEHQGEDAASPVRVEYRAGQLPIRPIDGNPLLDPSLVPAEAIVEAEPDDFWTPGRRITIGRAVEQAAAAAGRPLPEGDERIRLTGLPVPYDSFDGTGFDGRHLFRLRENLGLELDWFPERPPRTAGDLWNSLDLCYEVDFRAGPVGLPLRRHDGGALDWWSVDATVPVPQPPRLPDAESVLATRVQYPGAPNPRWWEIEETGADVGGYAPDRSHFASMLLIELVNSPSGDWFTFPVVAQSGRVLTLHEVTVVDSFDEPWTLQPPDDGWTLFATTGLQPSSLVLWLTAATALTGPILDQVDFGHDEDANLVWAVERRVGGRDLATPERPGPPGNGSAATTRRAYNYRPATEVPPHWHPYLIEPDQQPRRLIQGRLADLSQHNKGAMPLPLTNLLRSSRLVGEGQVHRIEPAALPAQGLQLERRYMLCRRTDGQPVLWKQRRRVPLAAGPTMRLQFDTFEPE